MTVVNILIGAARGLDSYNLSLPTLANWDVF
jgi:hypothetical protein